MNILKDVGKLNHWELIAPDFFQSYINFSYTDLFQLKKTINDEIAKINKSAPNRDELIKIENELIDYMKREVPDNYYIITSLEKEIRKHKFKYATMENTARRSRTLWITKRIKDKFEGTKGIKIKEDLENQTFQFVYPSTTSEKTKNDIRYLKKKELNEKYKKKTIQSLKTIRKAKKIKADVENFYKKYDESKKAYRVQAIKHQALLERWKRIIWVIDIELRLRKHEKDYNVVINRDFTTTNSKEWTNYSFKYDSNGLITNAFLLKNNVPYRVIAVEEMQNKSVEPIKYLKVYLEDADSTYEAVYSLIEPDELATQFTAVNRKDISINLLLEKDNIGKGSNYQIRDVDFFVPGDKVNNWEELLIEETDDDEEDTSDEDNELMPSVSDLFDDYFD